MNKNEAHTAVYEPAGEAGWWTVRIADVPGCISQGRSIAQARDRIREALALYLDVDESRIDLLDEVRFPREVRRAIDAYRKRRVSAERETEAASMAYRDAVRVALGSGLSTRDAGEALGVSQARIAQLAAEVEREPKRRSGTERKRSSRRRAA